MHPGAGDHRRLRQLPDRRRSRRTATTTARWASGYANLGALLMAAGLPYDSRRRAAHYAAAITALMCGEAYRMSAQIARAMGPFAGYAKNARAHAARDAASTARRRTQRRAETACARTCFAGAAGGLGRGGRRWASEHGYRNSQVTVLAPTGTIGFMMDCDTTGIEPDIALVKYKKLVGGGMMKIVNNTVPLALAAPRLQRPPRSQRHRRVLDENETIEGAPA